MKRRLLRFAKYATLGGFVFAATAGCQEGMLQALLDFGNIEMGQFSNCNDLESELKQRAAAEAGLDWEALDSGGVFDPFGFKDAAPSGAKGSFSETNVQEEGVDEADIFEVDGRYAYALHGDELVIIDGVDTLGRPDGTVLSETPLVGRPFAMYVTGDSAVVMTRTSHSEVKETFARDVPDREDTFPTVKAALYDVSDRSAPTLKRELFVEGDYVDSRRIDNRVFIVAKAFLEGPPKEAPGPNTDKDNWLEDRLFAIDSAQLDDWMPYYYDVKYRNGVATKETSRCSCSTTSAAPAAGGDQTLAIYSFDFVEGSESVETTTIIGDAAQVYASKDSIYVGMTNYADVEFSDGSTSSGEVTYLHHFALKSDGKVKYMASGQVEGFILNQFSMSEHDGYLRVATQINRGSSMAESMVFTLKASSKRQATFKSEGKLDDYLAVSGELRGIGMGEDLYAARFKGDVGYLVTFMQTDPLWVVDLSKPTRPKMRGSLEVPGYSTYLHPIENGRLLAVGVGSWGDEVKLSLFDVSNLDRPRAVQELELGDWGAYTEVFDDHHAFRYLPEQRIMALPIQLGETNGLHAYKVKENGLDFIKRVDHDALIDGTSGDARVRRSSRIGEYLFVYSGAGVTINDVDTLDLVKQVDLDDI